MKTSIIKLSLVLICIFNVLKADCVDAKKDVLEIKKTEYGKSFLENHSAKNFERIILFLEKPEKYFNSIKKIKNICPYISIYENFSLKRLNNQSIFTIFLKKNFRIINKKKADILAFLLATCDHPVYLEELADIYTKLFKTYYTILLKSLKKTSWEFIVGRLDSGSWDEFKKGVDQLGDTSFEKEFKEYVFAQRDEKGNRIKQ